MMRRILGIIPGVLAVAFATAQKPVQHIVVDQCEVLEIGVQEFAGDRYIWDLYSTPDVNFALEDGDILSDEYFEQGRKVGPSVRIHDLPPGRYFVRVMVWDEVACTNNLMVFSLEVQDIDQYLEVRAGEFCFGQDNYIRITFTGRGPWDLTYAWNDETNEQYVTLYGIVESNYQVRIPMFDAGKHSFWIMEVNDECRVSTYEIPLETEFIIHPRPRTSPIYLKPEEDEQQNP